MPKIDRPKDSDWVSTEHSSSLSGRKNKGTTPEIVLRKALFSRGLRYRKNRKILSNATADIVFPGPKVAIFVDGCFWHGCPTHGRKTFSGPNAENWKKKIERNRERDEEQKRAAEAEGWLVFRVWECEAFYAMESTASQIADAVYARKTS